VSHEPSGEVEVCRVGKEPLLKSAETVVATDRPTRHVERSHDAEEEIEKEARVEIVARVEAAGDRERPRHDVRFIRVVNERKPVVDTVEPQHRSHHQNSEKKRVPHRG